MINVFVMIFTNRLFYYRQKRNQCQDPAAEHAARAGARLEQDAGVDLRLRQACLHAALSQRRRIQDLHPIDFAQFFDSSEFAQLHKAVVSLSESDQEPDPIVINGSKPADGSTPRIYKIHLSILQRDKTGKAKLLLGTERDITENRLRKENARNMALRYHTIFNSSLVDMIYYNDKGQLADINDKACETFGIKDREALMRRKRKDHRHPCVQRPRLRPPGNDPDVVDH